MHTNGSGSTLIETLISLFVFSVAVLGFLQLDLHSQALLAEAGAQQQKQQLLNQFYEIVQVPDTAKNNCPACSSLTTNQLTLITWQQQLATLLPDLTSYYTVRSPRSLQITFCNKDDSCDNFIVQV